MIRLYADKIEVTADNRELPILHDTTLKIYEQEFVIILGHNGSGKSTLVKTLSGDIHPNSGSVLIDDVEISKIDLKRKAREIITLSQKAEDRIFLDLTLEENIALWESRFPTENQLSFEEIIGLTNAPERFLLLKRQQMKNFSGGEKQSILLSLSLAHPPKILFLDEHTASLDPKASHEIMMATNQAIMDNKITAIMVTHHLDDALLYGDRIIIMSEGKIVIDQKKSKSLSKNELKDMMDMGE
jgi:putative ABC transport system ATP-binding protein